MNAMTITLINSFIVPPDKDEEFLATWHETIPHFTAAPGFVEGRLHRNTGLNDTTFRYVNVALWRSVEDYRAAFRDFVPAGRRVPGIRAHPGLFEVAAEVFPK
jgi:heme-degrading monooxygenase HmoA